MANLSSLVHELRERIAASSSSPSHPGDGPDPLESRFRAVLPNLLQAYVLPSSTGLSLSIYQSLSMRFLFKLSSIANNLCSCLQPMKEK